MMEILRPQTHRILSGAAMSVLALLTLTGLKAQEPIDFASSQKLTLGGSGKLRGEIRLGTLSENQSLHGFALDLFPLIT